MGALSGKVAVVTGAAGGIGSAVCRRFAEEGCAVVAADLHEKPLDELVAELTAVGYAVTAAAAEVSTDAGNAAVLETARSVHGGLDVVVANAAVQIMGGIEESTEDQWQAQFRTNLYGAASGLRQAVPLLRARGGGSLVVLFAGSVI
jgi:dihydroanticapsin dehydrogenase